MKLKDLVDVLDYEMEIRITQPQLKPSKVGELAEVSIKTVKEGRVEDIFKYLQQGQARNKEVLAVDIDDDMALVIFTEG